MPKSTFNPDQNSEDSQAWFAVRVKSRCETIVATILRNKGFEALLPCYEARRGSSGRRKTIQFPLFPGYVFCRLDVRRRLPVLTTPGVLHFAGIGRTPIAINEDEIAAIQSAIRSRLPIEPWPYITVGQRIQIDDGPLAGLGGVCVAHSKEHRLVVSVTLLQRSIAIKIQRDWVSPISANRSSRLGAALLTGDPIIQTSARV